MMLSDEKLKGRVLRVAHRLIDESRSDWMRHDCVFNPKTFVRRVEKIVGVCEGDGLKILQELISDGTLEQIKGPDYYQIYMRATQKFVDELQRLEKIRLRLPAFTYRELERARAQAELTPEEIGRRKERLRQAIAPNKR